MLTRYLSFQKSRITKNCLYFILVILFLYFTGTNKSVLILVSLISLIFFIINLGFEYLKYRKTCLKINQLISELDKRYLIKELLNEPKDLYGSLYYRVLEKALYDMVTDMAKTKEEYQDYKEYIEEWIHEMKTPLTTIYMLDMTQKDSSNKISRELSKLSNLMETSLFYIRANTLEKDYHVREIYIFKIIHEVLLKEKAAIQEKRIAIEIIHDNVDVSVYTDKKWIEFILHQTLLNSIKYVKALGKISFKIIKEVGKIKLIIEDNGCGISSSDLPRVFEKGFTGSNKRRGEATGIGLYLCKKSADKMRIDLSIESRENEYTRVIIGFPVGDYYKLK